MLANRPPIVWYFLSLTLTDAWLLLAVAGITPIMTEYWMDTLGDEGLPSATRFALKWGVTGVCLATVLSVCGLFGSLGRKPQINRLTLGFNSLVLVELFSMGLLLACLGMPMITLSSQLGS